MINELVARPCLEGIHEADAKALQNFKGINNCRIIFKIRT
jgi:hypothetical protein